ncbi:MAG: DUF3299 domain-containing protein [Paracoccaceae bacterium]
MKSLIVLAVLAALGSAASASEIVEWPDLIDQSAQVFDDPYRDLSYDDIESLKTIVLAREALVQGGQTEKQKTELEQKAHIAERQLLDGGVDVDWLIEQRWVVAERREKAATAANQNLDGQIVTLTGFAIAAPADNDGTTVVYLVPERGMCSHMPPPNANQMIRARVSSDWRPRLMHEPVRLTGILSVEETKHSFRIVDGNVPMRASYVLQVSKTELFKGSTESIPKTNEWAASIAERLRASGQLPGQQKLSTD